MTWVLNQALAINPRYLPLTALYRTTEKTVGGRAIAVLGLKMSREVEHWEEAMAEMRRFHEIADQDYPCERHVSFLIKSPYNKEVQARGECPFAPNKIKKGEKLARFEVMQGRYVRYHRECIPDKLMEIEPEIEEVG